MRSPKPACRPEQGRLFCVSEGDCTSERGAGQFSIFGAVEENGGPQIFAGERRSDKMERVRGRCFTAVVWVAALGGGKNLESGWVGLSTGGAQEMQKGGGGKQWAGDSGQWSVPRKLEMAADFAGERRSNTRKRVRGRCFTAVVWVAALGGGKNLESGWVGLSTGGAKEMQKGGWREAVGRGQWAVSRKIGDGGTGEGARPYNF
jgi:hypothetical protein